MMMWLKADEPSSLSIDGVTGEVQEWRDFSGNPGNIKYLYQNLGSTGPQTRPAFRRIDPAMNYHPAVDFRTFGEYLVTDKAPFSMAKPDAFTVVSTVHLRQYGETTGEGNISYLMSFGRKQLSTSHGSATSIYHRQPAIGLGIVDGKQGVGRSIYHADLGVNGKDNLYNPNATTVTMHMTYFNKAVNTPSNNDRFVRFEADGMSEEIHYNSNHSGRYQGNQISTLTRDMLMNGEGTLGSGSRYSRNVIGTMGEVIAYEKILSDDEKAKVYSYLGLKYGITLDLDKSGTPASTDNFTYKLSDGTTVVWDGDSSDYKAYHNNVAAIVRDDAAKLNNLQSHSTDDGSAVLMGIGSRIGLNPELTGLGSDKEFIVWGNNGVPFSQRQLYNPDGADSDICGIMTQRLKRIWKVRTGTQAPTPTPYNVLIGAFPDLSSDPFPYGSNFNVAMLIADDPAKFENKTWDLAIPGVYMDNMHQFGFRFEPNQTYYFTFGALPNPYGIGCETCDPDRRPNRIDFYQWPRGGRSKTYILNSDGFEATVSTGFTGAGNAYFPAGFPYGGAQLYTRRLGAGTNIMRTTISLDKAALAVFDVRKLDYYYGRYNTVEIYGLCGNERIVPRLNYATVPSTATYNILGGGRAEAKRVNLTVGNRRTWMSVEFDRPVHTIHIDNKLLGTSGLKDFGVGPVELYCPVPPPPVNEDGLAITQQAIPQSVLLCREVTYTFHIINDNCNSKNIYFKAPLPAGMLWRDGSLTLDPAKVSGTVSIANAGRDLIIDSLIVEGSETTVFSARAYFADTASPGIYTNRAEISYERIVAGAPVTIGQVSCDRLTAGCEPTRVEALYSPRLHPLQITAAGIDGRKCYKPDEVVSVSITINNPNSETVQQAGFDAIYNEDFTLVTGSLTATSSLTGIGTPVIGDGFFSLEGASGSGFNIPSGSHTLSFQLKAGAQLLPDYNPDGTVMKYASGDTVYQNFNLSTAFVTLSTVDDCSPMLFDSAYSEFSVPAVPKVRIYGPKNICPSHTTTLSHWDAGTWESKNPDIATVSGNTVTAVSAGKAVFTFTLTGLDGVTACTAESDTLTVTATDVSISEDTLCIGNPATLTPSSGGTWSSNNTAVATVSGNTVSPVAAGTATLRFTATDGCTNTLDILVVATPSITSFSYGTNDTLCKSATSAMPALVGTAGGTFSASSTDLVLDPSTGEINPSASTDGIYTVTYTIPAHGTCPTVSETATVVIDVCGELNLSTTVSSSEVCVGDTTNVLITLDNTGSSPLTDVQVELRLSGKFTLVSTTPSAGTWSSGVWTISTLGAGLQATLNLILEAGSTTGAFSDSIWVSSFNSSPARDYDATPSNQKAIITLTINPAPVIQAADTEVCAGSQITLTAAGVTNWISGNTSIATVSVGGTVTGISAGTVWIKAVNGSNCTDSIEITVNPRPVPGIAAGFGSNFCLNDPAIDVTSHGTPAGGTFKGAGITGSPGAWTFDPAAAGTGTHAIRYVATNSSGCSDSVEHTVTVRDAPSSVTIDDGDTTLCSSVSAYTLSGTPSGGTFYMQTPVTGALVGSTFSPSIAGVGTHTVIYYYATGSGCGGRDTINITVMETPSFTLPSSLCDKNPIPLNGTPSGGVFSGTGVELTGGQYYFNSVVAGAGSHTITYTVGGCAVNVSINVGGIQPAAGRIYVDSSKNGNGSSWTCALNSLARAMRYAREYPASANEIWVAGGTYHPEDYIDYVEGTDSSDITFLLPTDAKIYGSFRGADGIAGFTGETNIDQRPFLMGGTNDSVVRVYSTILSGDAKDNDTEGNFTLNRDDNLRHVVVSVNGTTSATLDGFTITGGHATKDSAVMLGTDSFHGQSGAGLWILRSSSRFANLKILDGKATKNGGGVLINSATSLLDHVYVHGNEAGTGGGIHIENSSVPSIINAVVAGNSAKISSGGVHFLNSTGSLGNVLIAGNHTDGDGGGIVAKRDDGTGTVFFTNVTITGNNAVGKGGGLRIEDDLGTIIRMRNSVLTGNSASQHSEFSPDNIINNYLICYYSYVGGVTSFAPPSTNNLDGSVNIDFIAPAGSPAPTTAGNYRLKVTSPAISTGNTAFLQPGGSPSGAPDLSSLVHDIDGRERIFMSKIDLGPYQSQASKANVEYPDNVVGNDDCQILPPNFNWDVDALLSSGTPSELSTMNIPLTGDIDGDGYIEIIASGAGDGNTAKDIIIYKVYATDSIVKTQTVSIDKLHHNSPCAIADVNGDGKAELFVVNGGTGFPDAYKLSCYELNSSNIYVHKWNAPMSYYDQTETPAFQPMIADFDSDGVPEVFVGNKIYNAHSGARLVEISSLMTSFGLGGNAVHTTSSKNPSSVMAVADFDNDGTLEIAAGNKVYKADVYAGNVAVKTCPYAPGVGDGFTSVADVDLNGTLDVVVTRKSNDTAYIYIWNPASEQLIAGPVWTLSTNSDIGVSIAAIGNVNATPEPEIIVVVPLDANNSNIRLYNHQLNLISNRNVGSSGGTGISLFDFDQDGRQEIIWKGDAVTAVDTILSTTNAFDTWGSVAYGSHSTNEYPVVADVTGNGAAEIIVIASTSGTGDGTGELHVLAHKEGLFAPARPVWNQAAYNSVNINRDLTVTVPQPSPAMVFPGGDTPLNAYLQQQTLIDSSGAAVWVVPDVKTDTLSFNIHYYEEKDSLTVSFDVENLGSKVFGTPLYVSAYNAANNAAVNESNLIARDSLHVNLGIDSLRTFTLKIPKLKSRGITGVVIRVNDNGKADYIRLECDTVNNHLEFDPPTIVTPSDTAVCLSNPVVLPAAYSVGSQLVSSVHYKWEHRPTSADPWTTKDEGDISTPASDTLKLSIASFAYSDTGIYRISIASVGQPVYIADSKEFFVSLAECDKLILTKTADRTSLCVNDSVTFTIVVENIAASASALNVSVKDNWPQILSTPGMISTTGTTSFNSGTVTWDIGTVTAGRKDTLLISGRVLPATGIISDSVNKAYVATVDTFTYSSYNSAPDDLKDSVNIDVNCEGLTLLKTANRLNLCLNDSVTYTIVLINDSPNAILDVSVKDEWAQVLSDPFFIYKTGSTTASFASGTVDWNIGGMLSGQKDTLVVAGRVMRRGTGLASDTINRAYVATAGTTVNSSYADAHPEMRDSVSINVSCEGLTLSKTADNTALCVNDSVTFTVVAFNDGSEELLNVTVRDIWAPVLSPADIVSTTGTTTASFAAGTVEWTIGTMSAGRRDTLVVAGRVLSTGSGLTSDTVNRTYIFTVGATLHLNYADAPANMRDSVILLVGALPVIDFAPVDSVCIGNLPLTLTASATPAGGTGVFSGDGVTGNEFNPSKPGIYTVIYTYTAPNGCVDSASAEINVISVPVVPDIRLKLCPASDKEIILGAFLDSTAGNITWTPVFSPGITLLDATTGRIRGEFLRNYTYTFKYTLSLASCGSTTARLIMNTTKINAIRETDTIVMCPTVDSNIYVQLNQILGFEPGGTWVYDNTLNPDNTLIANVTLYPTSSRFAGALIFNAAKAWRDAGPAYDMTYNGDNQAKKFVFKYTPPTGSCLTKTRTIVIIATPMWL
jgi:uncharacterized repeat protein (TIGR01451 family)